MSQISLWLVIIGLGLVTFLMRACFILFLGHKELPEWAIRHLRYTAVAIIPGMIAPLIVFPKSLGGATNMAWIGGALIAIFIGLKFKNPLVIMLSGAAAYIILSVALSSGILS